MWANLLGLLKGPTDRANPRRRSIHAGRIMRRPYDYAKGIRTRRS